MVKLRTRYSTPKIILDTEPANGITMLMEQLTRNGRAGLLEVAGPRKIGLEF